MRTNAFVVVAAAFTLSACGTAWEPDELSDAQLIEDGAELTAGPCRATGCGGATCADKDIAINASCTWKSKMDCYTELSACKQVNGQCKWVPKAGFTELFKTCRDTPPNCGVLANTNGTYWLQNCSFDTMYCEGRNAHDLKNSFPDCRPIH